MKKASASHQTELAQEIINELVVEFMEVGYNQTEAIQLANETIVSNNQLFIS